MPHGGSTKIRRKRDECSLKANYNVPPVLFPNEVFVSGVQREIHDEAGENAGYGIDGIMGQDIEGGEEHQNTKGHERPEERAVLCGPRLTQ